MDVYKKLINNAKSNKELRLFNKLLEMIICLEKHHNLRVLGNENPTS